MIIRKETIVGPVTALAIKEGGDGTKFSLFYGSCGCLFCEEEEEDSLLSYSLSIFDAHSIHGIKTTVIILIKWVSK